MTGDELPRAVPQPIAVLKFKPTADITGTFTFGNLGIRWPSSYGGGVNLSRPTGTFGYGIEPPGKLTSGSYDFVVFNSGNNIPSTTYTAVTEYTLMTVTVSGGTGTGTFELCPGGFAGDAGAWYIEIGGGDKANPDPAQWYYQASVSNVPLPVELTSFTSKYLNDKVQLNWETKTEVNNYGFNVERRINEGEWNWLGTALDNMRLSTGTEKVAVTDDSTDVYNQRFVRTALNREIRRASRHGQELSLALVALDPAPPQLVEQGEAPRGGSVLKELASVLAKDPKTVVLDVRGKLEFETPHLDGAMNIAAPDVRQRHAVVPRDRPVYVICNSGHRSSLACSILLQKGFKNVSNAVGGMMGFSAAGLIGTCPICVAPHLPAVQGAQGRI